MIIGNASTIDSYTKAVGFFGGGGGGGGRGMAEGA